MKIAMIGHKRIPSREGGVEIVVEELSTRMATLGHNVVVYNRKKKLDAEEKNKQVREYKGVKLKSVFTINKKSLDAVVYTFIATIRALFGRYDVIHYHAEGPCSMLWIPHLFGIRTVATIHGLDWQRAKWGGIATKFLKYGEKIAAKYADEVIVLSKNVQQYFKDTYDRDVRYIPNGVNEPATRDADIINHKYGLTKDSYILFLARIVPEKGLHYLLEAYKQIDTDKKLVIAGASSHSNDYVDKIKAMASQDKRVMMTGFVQGEELDELFSNAYLYVLPSDIEGMPISLLEAMSYGCCCLVSDIDENLEVVGEFATCFQKGNVNDLTEKLNLIGASQIGLYDSNELKSYVLRNYNWDSVVNKTVEIY